MSDEEDNGLFQSAIVEGQEDNEDNETIKKPKKLHYGSFNTMGLKRSTILFEKKKARIVIDSLFQIIFE